MPGDSLQSEEEADTEVEFRRAYFTDLDRSGALSFYQDNFKTEFFGYNLPNYRLNYPPEEAQTIIRDQTRSYYLEEIVYPFRESLYVNGFFAQSSKDTIFIENRVWNQKLTIRYVDSERSVRFAVGVLTSMLFYVVMKRFIASITMIKINLIK